MIAWAIAHWPWLVLASCLLALAAWCLRAATDKPAPQPAAQPWGDEAGAIIFEFPRRDGQVIDLAARCQPFPHAGLVTPHSGGAERAVANPGRAPANTCGRRTRPEAGRR